MTHCPNCGNQVEPSWKRCGFCGISLTFETIPQEQFTPPAMQQDLKKYLPYAAILLVAVVAIFVVVLISNNPQKNNSPLASELEAPVLFSDPIDTPTNESQNKTGETPYPASNIIIVTATPENKLTETRTPTQGKTCPDTFAPRVAIDDRAMVCTRSDRLIIRVDPEKGAREIARIYPGTIVKILSGPECGDKSSWWWIQVPKGTNVYFANVNRDGRIDEDLIGWVREGGDTIDRYYLCKIED